MNVQMKITPIGEPTEVEHQTALPLLIIGNSERAHRIVSHIFENFDGKKIIVTPRAVSFKGARVLTLKNGLGLDPFKMMKEGRLPGLVTAGLLADILDLSEEERVKFKEDAFKFLKTEKVNIDEFVEYVKRMHSDDEKDYVSKVALLKEFPMNKIFEGKLPHLDGDTVFYVGGIHDLDTISAAMKLTSFYVMNDSLHRSGEKIAIFIGSADFIFDSNNMRVFLHDFVRRLRSRNILFVYNVENPYHFLLDKQSKELFKRTGTTIITRVDMAAHELALSMKDLFQDISYEDLELVYDRDAMIIMAKGSKKYALL